LYVLLVVEEALRGPGQRETAISGTPEAEFLA
jgi:hypothetical protein